MNIRSIITCKIMRAHRSIFKIKRLYSCGWQTIRKMSRHNTVIRVKTINVMLVSTYCSMVPSSRLQKKIEWLKTVFILITMAVINKKWLDIGHLILDQYRKSIQYSGQSCFYGYRKLIELYWKVKYALWF